MSTPGRQARILIVDDEAAHMRALCDTLGAHGYETTGLVSAEAALTLLRTEAFELLLTDLNLPGINGIALVQQARRIDSDLTCIIMTGEGSISTAVQALQTGALDYIVKPFKVAAILPILARAREARQLRIRNAGLELQLRRHAAELDAMNRQLAQATQQAEQANQAKSLFLSNMSHELRTPLNAILGFAQVLISDVLPTNAQEKKKFAGHIVDAGKHLLTLINEVLDLAKVEAGALSLSLEPVALREVFAECRDLVAPLAQQRGIALDFVAAPAQHVLADRTRLKQVLVNLLSNAIKYNREHGAVSLECAPGAAGRLRIRVRDDGAGLSEAQLAATFQSFNRLGREGSNEEGTGLGLALSKRLVEAMGGEIGVDSALGVGSTFWIELAPCADAAPPAVKAAAPVVVALTGGARHCVLYVEDNPLNLRLVEQLLRLRSDLDLLAAADGRRGVELARSHAPRVILMDIDLPGMDGVETLRVLRADPRTAHIPVVAISASALRGDIRRGMAAGFFDYISKPIDIAAFAATLDGALAFGAAGRAGAD
ncbi:response regulator [Janthinobacterium sp.]|uniref:ATP-binding response regulator n=1 Tax=Janthinobacterium sp. TaxID=1871054 RepID=UPI00293D3AEF|nr:response regulator [Janthinobacterium sp.]